MTTRDVTILTLDDLGRTWWKLLKPIIMISFSRVNNRADMRKIIAVMPRVSYALAMRRAAAIVILYAFTHSFYGVGSLKNAFGMYHLEGAGRIFAMLFGLIWLALFLGGVVILIRKQWGLHLARAAAGAAAITLIAGNAIITFNSSDLFTLLVTLSQPVFAIFLFALLPFLSHDTNRHPAGQSWTSASIIAAGALLPWVAALAVRVSSFGTPPPWNSPGLFISLFMSFWSALPFVVLMQTVAAWEPGRVRTSVLTGGFIGAASASLYAFGLLWAENTNSFLMALMPPLIFAGEAIGVVMGMVFGRMFRKSSKWSDRVK